tara:strand:- start:371 stop:592 length:222 start_codon:yes stop_codon:yes gene_type:complete
LSLYLYGKKGVTVFFVVYSLGIGMWAFINLFHIPTKVSNHTMVISSQIAEIERSEKEEMHSINMAMIAASKNN